MLAPIRPRYSSSPAIQNTKPEDLLGEPSWSVRSLLPDSSQIFEASQSISPDQLHHLLRLSALPQPKNQAEEDKMLKTLRSQIHFVKEVQDIDTTGVAPLVALRDETPEGLAEITITSEDLREAFALEKRVGRNGRIKRQNPKKSQPKDGEDWDPLKMAEKHVGRFFVVQKAKSNGSSREV
ncbi:MAG: hypothetical protein Q9227_001006 [Pyrenula ochraceoflavens]